METYESFLNIIKSEISFGSTTIHIHRPHELEDGQLGYSLSAAGDHLIDDEAGSWQKSWLVIGYDETCGDPIFINRAEDGYPVYIAMVGKGIWNPKRIAVSLAGFAHAISAITAIAENREYPEALERNPLAQSDKDSTLDVIRKSNPGIDIDFWETLLDES